MLLLGISIIIVDQGDNSKHYAKGEQMKKVFAAYLGMVFLMAGALAGSVLAGGTADEAKALADKAVEFFKANGKDKAFEAFNNPQGEFVKGDLYIFVNDYSGNTLAHGGNSKLVGKNLNELKDADGKAFFQEFASKAKSGGGWVDYKWSNPETKKIQPKSTYIKAIDGTDFYLGCGIYK